MEWGSFSKKVKNVQLVKAEKQLKNKWTFKFQFQQVFLLDKLSNYKNKEMKW